MDPQKSRITPTCVKVEVEQHQISWKSWTMVRGFDSITNNPVKLGKQAN